MNTSRFNTLMFLMAVFVITQRVLTPFLVPPLIAHEDGTLELCSWHGSHQRVLLSADGVGVEKLASEGHCPACTASAALAFNVHSTESLSLVLAQLEHWSQPELTPAPHYLLALPRAPPIQLA